MVSTYVNDLRLNEMATGDQSGSWGTVTNTNLELIAEAFSYSTEAITTNADTHTTTIADGATDPGRSMFLKYTGTLDSACTITIGPNTVSKLWFIENATSGSQNIIIKQGSGATVTIASGKTKVIYSDGVGSGAKMVDAFAALDVGALSGTSATFDGGVDIDNINIDGTTIALSSGNLTLDVAGELILDADTSGVVRLKDGGTEYGTLFTTSSNFLIKSQGNDKDIIFQGNDSGGSGFTALTLDMSNGGRANFNNDIGLIDNRGLKLGSGDDSVIYNDGSNTYIRNNTSNQDIIFQGNDDGSANTTALTLDMSDAGTAIFNHDIKLNDAGRLFLGTNNDAQIYNTGSHTYIQNYTTNQDIIFNGIDDGSSITALTLDMSNAGAANFNAGLSIGGTEVITSARALTNITNLVVDNIDLGGNAVTVGSGNLTLDVAGEIVLDADTNGVVRINDAGSNFGAFFKNGTTFTLKSEISDYDMVFSGNDGGATINALTLDMSAAGAATFNNDVTAFSDERLKSNITTIPDALSKVTEMRGVHYVRDATGKDSTGVIAQEMQKVAPELVLTADDEMGTLSVNYGNITGYLIEAIKELKAEIEELKAR